MAILYQAQNPSYAVKPCTTAYLVEKFLSLKKNSLTVYSRHGIICRKNKSAASRVQYDTELEGHFPNSLAYKICTSSFNEIQTELLEYHRSEPARQMNGHHYIIMQSVSRLLYDRIQLSYVSMAQADIYGTSDNFQQ